MSLLPKDAEPPAPEHRALAAWLARRASAELAHLRRIRGPGRRTARRIARARRVLALAGALVGSTLASVARAGDPLFLDPFAPFGLADVGQYSSPEFADLDGDLDGLFGNSVGDVNFLENTGDAASPAFGAPMLDPFGLGLDQSYFSNAALLDIDGDGDLDAFVGELDGEIGYGENTGSATAPAFAALDDSPFGLMDVGLASDPSFADLDGDGDFDALVGSADAGLSFFRNTGTDATPAFASPLTDPFGLVTTDAASPALADIDGDGDLDAFVGIGTETVFFRNLSAP